MTRPPGFRFRIVLRAALWGLSAGMLVGAAYGLVLTALLASAILGRDSAIGSIQLGGSIGAAGGLALGIVAGLAIAGVPPRNPASAEIERSYRHDVQRAAARWTLGVGVAASGLFGGIGGMLFLLVPVGLAAATAFVLAPRIVRWNVPLLQRDASER